MEGLAQRLKARDWWGHPGPSITAPGASRAPGMSGLTSYWQRRGLGVLCPGVALFPPPHLRPPLVPCVLSWLSESDPRSVRRVRLLPLPRLLHLLQVPQLWLWRICCMPPFSLLSIPTTPASPSAPGPLVRLLPSFQLPPPPTPRVYSEGSFQPRADSPLPYPNTTPPAPLLLSLLWGWGAFVTELGSVWLPDPHPPLWPPGLGTLGFFRHLHTCCSCFWSQLCDHLLPTPLHRPWAHGR